jgi:hypothetical protein
MTPAYDGQRGWRPSLMHEGGEAEQLDQVAMLVERVNSSVPQEMAVHERPNR